MSNVREITCTAPVNIALIKYWGKRDETLILPLNSSLSVTLDQADLRTTTYVKLDRTIKDDKLIINSEEQSLNTPRYQKCLQTLREMSNCHDKFSITSENNFPTAAGLASSASGFACLVFSLANLLGVNEEMSKIARQGSGSACRSMYGGFVQWNKGDKVDGDDSKAIQIVDHLHWPELEILILVASDQKKQVSSTRGMQNSVETSELLRYRVEHIVPERISKMKQAILDKDFQTVAKLSMQDSNQFHAVCLDTYPPLFYLNGTSRNIINMVTAYNEFYGEIRLGYTYDAGPNACLLVLKNNIEEVKSLILNCFPPTNREKFFHGRSNDSLNVQELRVDIKKQVVPDTPDSLKYVIHTGIGSHPQVLTHSQIN